MAQTPGGDTARALFVWHHEADVIEESFPQAVSCGTDWAGGQEEEAARQL